MQTLPANLFNPAATQAVPGRYLVLCPLSRLATSRCATCQDNHSCPSVALMESSHLKISFAQV
jgi:hypothetical protein